MAKYSSKTYARALSVLILEKESKKNLNGFLDFIRKNGDLKKTKEVIALTEAIFYKKTGKRKITLEIARKIERKNILKDFFQEGDIVKEKINPELIAGLKVNVNNEKQLDYSLKSKLDNLLT